VPDAEIVGVKALVKDFDRMAAPAGPLAAALRTAGRTAITPIADAARSAVPHVTGTLAGSVVVETVKLGAKVAMTAIYAGPVDFGGYPGDRPYLPQGRYLYPAAARLGQAGEQAYADAVAATLERYPWTNATTDAGSVHE
jgi:hypothetical protein